MTFFGRQNFLKSLFFKKSYILWRDKMKKFNTFFKAAALSLAFAGAMGTGMCASDFEIDGKKFTKAEIEAIVTKLKDPKNDQAAITGEADTRKDELLNLAVSKDLTVCLDYDTDLKASVEKLLKNSGHSTGKGSIDDFLQLVSNDTATYDDTKMKYAEKLKPYLDLLTALSNRGSAKYYFDSTDITAIKEAIKNLDDCMDKYYDGTGGGSPIIVKSNFAKEIDSSGCLALYNFEDANKAEDLFKKIKAGILTLVKSPIDITKVKKAHVETLGSLKFKNSSELLKNLPVTEIRKTDYSSLSNTSTIDDLGSGATHEESLSRIAELEALLVKTRGFLEEVTLLFNGVTDQKNTAEEKLSAIFKTWFTAQTKANKKKISDLANEKKIFETTAPDKLSSYLGIGAGGGDPDPKFTALKAKFQSITLDAGKPPAGQASDLFNAMKEPLGLSPTATVKDVLDKLKS